MTALTLNKPGQKVRLSDYPEQPPKGLTEKKVQAEFGALCEELFDLQDLLWGARRNSVLVVLQGRDTAGKDGAINHVVGCLNPRGVHVTSFGAPTQEELDHDFLWRVHRHAPRKGEFAIFNRSHYEDVLVARVNKLVPKPVWKERFGHIRDFEELLAEHGTIVLKFFLHISLEEQEKRLLKREQDPRKAWKINAGDWKDRDHWDGYTEAYEDALSRTSTKTAPWTLVPADAKWYRNLVLARAIAEALRPYRKAWQAQLDAVGEAKKEELAQYRQKK
ncbi:PPK2 family polyphosphate kinase [Stigmatella hybrida]|uniref:PPK2 family polyphosphate kinase n=1 Tax=Stigmatella hybrida TaxID=394097 RepID=UPI001CDA936E|nr:PPK2 family polyphosphate kinase [Stigmatella hybrida]